MRLNTINYLKKGTSLLFLVLLSGLLSATQDREDSLRQAIKTEENPIRRYHAMVLLASEFTPFQMDSARVLLEQSSMLSGAIEHPIERAAWLNISGNYNWYIRNQDSAMHNYRITYGMDYPGIIDRQAAAAVNMASLYSSWAYTDSALVYFNRAIDLFEESGDEAGSAHVSYSLGLLHIRRDNYELALRNLLQSLQYRQEQADTFDLMHTHNALGNVYMKLNNLNKSKEHYLTSSAMGENYTQHRILPSVYSNLAHLHLISLQDDEQGIFWAEKAIELGRERNNQEAVFSTFVNLGKMHQRRGDLEQARGMISGALDEFEGLVPIALMVGARNILAEVLLDLGDYNTAQQEAESALHGARTLESLDDMARAKQLFFRIDSLKGDYLGALTHYQASRILYDSIWKKDRADRLAELVIIYETEKKEAENLLLVEANVLKEEIIANQQRLLAWSIAAIGLFVLLVFSLFISWRNLRKKNSKLEHMHREITEKQAEIGRKNTILDKQTKELSQLNQTKDKFFSIIAHDLRGPFTALMGLVEILREDMETMDTQERKEIVSDLQVTSRRAYELTVNLLEWARVQRKMLVNEPRQVHIEEVINKSLHLLDFNIKRKGHRVQKDIAPVEVLVDPYLLQSVLTNLLNNSVKFTEQGGSICISASLGEEGLRICIEDNGIGIPAELLSQLYELNTNCRRIGTEGEGGTGLGLINSREFIELMGGQLEIKSEVGKGSCFCFTIPTSA